jgi:hypothetical protein
LDGSCGSVELLLQVVQTTERLDDSLFESAILQYTTVSFLFVGGRSKIFPEEGVIDMT